MAKIENGQLTSDIALLLRKRNICRELQKQGIGRRTRRQIFWHLTRFDARRAMRNIVYLMMECR